MQGAHELPARTSTSTAQRASVGLARSQANAVRLFIARRTHRLLRLYWCVRRAAPRRCPTTHVPLRRIEDAALALARRRDKFDIGRAKRQQKRNKMRRVIMFATKGTFARCFEQWASVTRTMAGQRAKIRQVVVKLLKRKMVRGRWTRRHGGRVPPSVRCALTRRVRAGDVVP